MSGGLFQGAAEPHLWPEQLQGVTDHIVNVNGEGVVLGPNVHAFFPPNVPLHKTQANCTYVTVKRLTKSGKDPFYTELHPRSVQPQLILQNAARILQQVVCPL